MSINPELYSFDFTDIEKVTTGNAIGNLMRKRNTDELLGIWEISNNPDLNVIEFDDFRKNAGLNSFTVTPSKWIEATGAIGIRVKRGRHGVLLGINPLIT